MDHPEWFLGENGWAIMSRLRGRRGGPLWIDFEGGWVSHNVSFSREDGWGASWLVVL